MGWVESVDGGVTLLPIGWSLLYFYENHPMLMLYKFPRTHRNRILIIKGVQKFRGRGGSQGSANVRSLALNFVVGLPLNNILSE
jgi:hypothetical protein